MFERIDPRSPIPLYAQIASRIRLAVAAGDLPHGHALPSVRQLSAELRVNPATVVQAYRELEGDGFVERRHGSGTFVLEIPQPAKDEEKQAQAERLIQEMLDHAARVGITASEMFAAFERAEGISNDV